MHKLFILGLLISFHAFSDIDLKIGKFNSRAVLSFAKGQSPAPLIILIPGSGAHGPQELIPASMTLTNKDEALFTQLRNTFNSSGVHTLALGKPGVEYLKPGTDREKFYDRDMYINSRWEDLLSNVDAAITELKSYKQVDLSSVYLLGHSEGTKVAIDYTTKYPDKIKGLILLGYSAENLETTLIWQMIDRTIEYWISPDIDLNNDNYITKKEAGQWDIYLANTFTFWNNINDHNLKIPLSKFRESLANNDVIKSEFKKYENYLLWSDGVFSGEPYYKKTATLAQDVWIFTGELDLQTRAAESIKQKDYCNTYQKKNCYISIVPGVGHGFSPPRPPRKHPLLDITIGPFSKTFLTSMNELGNLLSHLP